MSSTKSDFLDKLSNSVLSKRHPAPWSTRVRSPCVLFSCLPQKWRSVAVEYLTYLLRNWNIPRLILRPQNFLSAYVAFSVCMGDFCLKTLCKWLFSFTRFPVNYSHSSSSRCYRTYAIREVKWTARKEPYRCVQNTCHPPWRNWMHPTAMLIVCPHPLKCHFSYNSEKYLFCFSLFPVDPTWSIGHPRNALFHFSFSNLRQSVGLLGRGISPSRGRYLSRTTQTE
jgi:hypothetical protein